MLIAEEYAVRQNLSTPLLRYKNKITAFQKHKSIFILKIHWNSKIRRVGNYDVTISKFQHNSPEISIEKVYESIEWEYLENFFINCSFLNSVRFFIDEKDLDVCKLKINLIKYDDFLSKQKDSILMHVISEFLSDENQYLRVINYISACYNMFWNSTECDLNNILENYSFTLSRWFAENVG